MTVSHFSLTQASIESYTALFWLLGGKVNTMLDRAIRELERCDDTRFSIKTINNKISNGNLAQCKGSQ